MYLEEAFGVPLGYLLGSWRTPWGYLEETSGVLGGDFLGYLEETSGVPGGDFWGTLRRPLG